MSEKKFNKKIIIATLLCILVLILILIVIFIISKQNSNNVIEEKIDYINTLSPEEQSIIKGNSNNLENVILDTNGTKINTSAILTNQKNLDNSITVDNVMLACIEGKSSFYANINNNSNSIISSFEINIKFIDNGQNIIYETEKKIPAIDVDSKYILEEIIEQDISNAYDVIITKK